MESIYNFFGAITLTNMMGIYLYWLPLLVCALGFTIRTWVNFQQDHQSRSVYETHRAEKRHTNVYVETYRPTDTIGTLIARAIVTFVPIANLWVALFDLTPMMLSRYLGAIGKLFDIPLVPRRSIADLDSK